MKALELAKQLGKALAESEEYQAYQKAKEALEIHEAAKVMLEDFRKKQWELEKQRVSGAIDTAAVTAEQQKLAEIIQINPYIREYLFAEFRFSQIMMEVQRELGKGVGIDYPDAPELEPPAAEGKAPEAKPEQE
jgi:cell fate (sporulation/competence/biofilm development) regulator YlbF (YheA/YmcA/DUF963 family)